MTFLIAVLGVLTLGIEAASQVGAAEVQILPEHPTEGSGIVLVVSGTWTDSCVPKLAEVRISRKHIVVVLESSATSCSPRPTPWELEGAVEGCRQGLML